MSLGLVAYDDSEESENESDTEPTQTIAVPDPQKKTELTKKPTSVIESGHISDEELESTTGVNGTAHFSDEEVESSFNKPANLHLPESKLSLINTDIDIKCLTSISRKGGPVKITIPSLNEVNDEDEPPSKKKLKPSQKGSGLFALLPSPKSSLVPQSVSRKPTPAVNKSLPVASAKKSKIPVTKASTLISYEDSGDEEEVSGTVDFFSLESKDKDVTPVDVNIDIPEVSTSSGEVEVANASSSTRSSSDWQHLQAANASTSSSYLVQPENPQQSDFGYSTSEFMTVSNSDLELDQQAMQQLCGRRDRIKMQEVNLIDVSGDKIMPDSREWLTKQLTEEVVHRPSHKRKDGPTSQQKRKHQITYLAYQAKENELELKNQWANNRMSRKQTQAKYGF
ncbi:proline-rich protein PRCC-like [Macrosteles quadrilineatus]|uniref:proline-rich protein PRCC-like n=1 Tax=Macrosteles quadrilineatus TaxID=74068 RepID=UPI0023E12FC4|nr:proline-rich protein PRCC-like [Macrosteles quadrilineatus]